MSAPGNNKPRAARTCYKSWCDEKKHQGRLVILFFVVMYRYIRYAGTTVEFRPPGSFPRVTDMTGGGPFNLVAGQVCKPIRMLSHGMYVSSLHHGTEYCV